MLAVDVGNTHITCAVIEGSDIRLIRRMETGKCLEKGSFFKDLDLAGEELSARIVLSSVRKPVTGIISRECEGLFGAGPFIVTNETPMGITNLYQTPQTLGTDRLVDAAACHHLYLRGERPGIIVDMGTATTIDYITGNGEFLGGAIAPGLLSAYRGMLSAAPELPEIDIEGPESLVGATTGDCIRSGVIAGHAALIRSLASMMAKEKGSDPLVVVTGGLSRLISAWMPKEFVHDEHLLLRGLGIIYNINVKNC